MDAGEGYGGNKFELSQILGNSENKDPSDGDQVYVVAGKVKLNKLDSELTL